MVQITPIKDLEPDDTRKFIEAKVYRKWIATKNEETTPVSLCSILIDEEGTGVQVNINTNDSAIFDKYMQINKAYRISNFICEKTLDWQRTLPTKVTLTIGKCANFEPIPPDRFPQHCFHFASYDEVCNRIEYQTPILTDYIGCICNIGNIQHSKNPNSRKYFRLIDIIDLNNNYLQLILWNERATSFPIDEYESHTKPVLIAVSSCWPNIFTGTGMVQLKPTPATYYYLNPNIPEYQNSISAYRELFSQKPMLLADKNRRQDPQEEQRRNRITLQELNTYDFQNNKVLRNNKYTCEAKIQQVENNRPWFYASCDKERCNKKVGGKIHELLCPTHGTLKEANFSYCFRILITDGTSTITLALLCNNAEKLLGISCKKMIVELGFDNKYVLPDPIKALEGTTHIFQFHYQSPNQYMVDDIFPINHTATYTPPNTETPPTADIDTPKTNTPKMKKNLFTSSDEAETAAKKQKKT
ncbi:uncharacterized protein [Rutidosis leptorrhynchoides]|uniref:uncharacterized protein n=1 Tax=Rutidosis leptorrhynchoides TaxID=125765 RepID=UPI003A9A4311